MLFNKLRSMVFYCWVCFFVVAAMSSNTALANNKTAESASQAPSAISSIAAQKENTLTNINSADVTTLQKIKGMGKRKAQAIIRYRTKNGAFKSLEDLLNVSYRGINKAWLKKVSRFLTV